MMFDILDLGLVKYDYADGIQRGILEEVKTNIRKDTLILAEFFPVFTKGRKGSMDSLLVSADFLKEMRIDFQAVDRGGDITFHNPGQLIAYPIFNLSGIKKDLEWYLRTLEEIIIRTLLEYGICAGRKAGFTGAWVGDKKIASIGIGVSRWVSYHGISVNVNNDLSFFDFINPCGIKDCRMASVSELKGASVDMDEFKKGLTGQFEIVFGIKVNAETAAAMA